MAKEAGGKRGGGSSLQRTDVVTVRLDPKINYFADLAARRQRRTKSSVIEWYLEQALQALFEEFPEEEQRDLWNDLWSPFESDRFAKLALYSPELLNFEEQVRWQLIAENGLLWSGWYGERDGVYRWSRVEESLRLARLRDYFDLFCRVAKGEESSDQLPKWPKTRAEISQFPDALRHEYEAAPVLAGLIAGV